jgi:hypothetical protein
MEGIMRPSKLKYVPWDELLKMNHTRLSACLKRARIERALISKYYICDCCGEFRTQQDADDCKACARPVDEYVSSIKCVINSKYKVEL